MNKEQVRIRNNCIKINECWIWTLYIDAGGYGRTKFRGKNESVHRASYIAFKGEIPEGLHIDHLCRHRNCANPEHLEAVTQYQNTMRGFNPAAINARKTHCLRGHEFDNGNTYIDPKGKRGCRSCAKIWLKTYLDRCSKRCVGCENMTTGKGLTGYCKPCTNRLRVLEFKK